MLCTHPGFLGSAKSLAGLATHVLVHMSQELVRLFDQHFDDLFFRSCSIYFTTNFVLLVVNGKN
jgi:hypothetical protein